MKNDYASGAGLEPHHPAVNNSRSFMPSRLITSAQNLEGAGTERSYKRNIVYSAPRRTNYLQLPANQASGQTTGPEISRSDPNSSPASLGLSNGATSSHDDMPRTNFAEAVALERKTHIPKVRKHVPFRGIAVLVIAVVTLALAGLVVKSSSPEPFSKQLASTVDIKLYYPSVMPSGYHVINSSIKMTTSESMHFEISRGKNIIQVNESKAESSHDIARVIQANFEDTSTLKTSRGNAVIAYQKSSPGVFGSLVSKDGSWITVTSGINSNSLSAVTTIMSSLQPVTVTD